MNELYSGGCSVVAGAMAWFQKGIAVQYSILVSGFRGPFQSAIVFIVYYSRLLCPDWETTTP